MGKLFLVLAIFAGTLTANIGPQGFGEYCQEYFVETGTQHGQGIQKALDAGFKEVRSLEAFWEYVVNVRNRFSDNPNVKIYHGDSAVDLWDVIADIDQPITFWLDAHIDPPRKDGGKNCPLLDELEQIKRHPIKTHIILIDDLHCCNTPKFDYLSKRKIINKILEINPDYQISYVEGGDQGEYKDNVMVAIPRP